MEVFTLIFMFALPIGFFFFANRFKGIMALILLAPILMMNIIGISLNSGFDETNPPALEYTFTPCNVATANATAYIDVNDTSHATYNNEIVCGSPVTEKYLIGFQNMQIFNALIGIFTLVMVFVVWRRITREAPTPVDR